jgi:transcriptional regulator with GAF, ATPase, and Fis domain
LESELFGHERGAFTGAVAMKKGRFELAEGGTLFLDEIGELPLHLQVKLLRVLEDRQIQRLGSERPERVDVRILAATNRNLEEEVELRRFRPDLYYRLAVVTLGIPPLRERPEDVPELVERYMGYFRRTLGKHVDGIADEALAALVRHDWPGNVRELINVLERSLLLSHGPLIALGDLPRSIAGGPPRRGGAVDTRIDSTLVVPQAVLDLPLREARRVATATFEDAYVSHLLTQSRGRVGDAARNAGVSPRAMNELMRRTGLDKADFRP